MLKEARIYWSSYSKGFGSVINSKVETSTYQFGSLTFEQIKGVFIIYSIAISIAVSVLLTELIKFYGNTFHEMICKIVKTVETFPKLCFKYIMLFIMFTVRTCITYS